MTFSPRLFPLMVEAADIPAIKGLTYLPDYIDRETESELAALIDQHEWDTTWERRRQLYGGAYGSSSEPPRPLPAWGIKLADRIRADGLTTVAFDQLLVNEYLPGQGIALHHDYQTYGQTVASVSLLAPTIMGLCPSGRPAGCAAPGAAEHPGTQRRGTIRVETRDRTTQQRPVAWHSHSPAAASVHHVPAHRVKRSFPGRGKGPSVETGTEAGGWSLSEESVR